MKTLFVLALGAVLSLGQCSEKHNSAPPPPAPVAEVVMPEPVEAAPVVLDIPSAAAAIAKPPLPRAKPHIKAPRRVVRKAKPRKRAEAPAEIETLVCRGGELRAPWQTARSFSIWPRAAECDHREAC